MGEFEKTIFKQSRRQRMELPDEVKNAPVLMPGVELYWEAFGFLTTCRSIGMGEGPIPWTAMLDYALDKGIYDPDDREDFYHIIRDVDVAYLAASRAQSKKAKGGNDGESSIVRVQNARTRARG